MRESVDTSIGWWETWVNFSIEVVQLSRQWTSKIQLMLSCLHMSPFYNNSLQCSSNLPNTRSVLINNLTVEQLCWMSNCVVDYMCSTFNLILFFMVWNRLLLFGCDLWAHFLAKILGVREKKSPKSDIQGWETNSAFIWLLLELFLLSEAQNIWTIRKAVCSQPYSSFCLSLLGSHWAVRKLSLWCATYTRMLDCSWE